MSWQVVIRPEAELDVSKAADWYNAQQPGLGAAFASEVIRTWDDLADNPLRNSRRHPQKNIRWRYPARFPYRIIYEVLEQDKIVIVAAVLHAARHDRHWQKRV